MCLRSHKLKFYRACRAGRESEVTLVREKPLPVGSARLLSYQAVLATRVIRSKIERQRKLSPFLFFAIYSPDR